MSARSEIHGVHAVRARGGIGFAEPAGELHGTLLSSFRDSERAGCCIAEAGK